MTVDDPYTERFLGLILRGLVRYDAKGKAVPEAAASIQTEDNQVYTVKLRTDGAFSNGEPVTASSFVDAWNLAVSDPADNPRVSAFAPILGFRATRLPVDAPGAARELVGLRILDKDTFTITLTQPQPGFADTLGDLAFAPLPSSALTDPQTWSRHPVGNGPYRVDGAWPSSPGARLLRLRPDPAYRGTQPPMNAGLDVQLYSSPSAAYADLEAGRLDVLDQVPIARLPDYPRQLAPSAINQPVGVAQSLVIPVTGDPWQGAAGLARRQAISTAVDRAKIASTVLAGTALPATDLSAPVVAGYSATACGSWCTQDTARARERATAAGSLPDPLTIAFVRDADDGPLAAAICAQVQTVLAVTCRPRAYPTWRALAQALDSGKESGPYLETWRMHRPTLAAFLVPRFTSDSPDNRSGFSSQLVDTRFDTAATAPVSQQPADYARIEAEILATLPVIPLWSRNAVGGAGPDVAQVRTDVFGSVIYAEITRPTTLP